VEITLLGDLNGYNGSKDEDGQGPYLSVHNCDMVVLSLENRDVQAHGLAVDLYSPRGPRPREGPL